MAEPIGLDQEGLRKEQERKARLRKAAIEETRGIGRAAGEGVTALEQAAQAGQRNIRHQSARGLAAALGSAPVAGGARLAAGRAASTQAGLAGAQFGAQSARDIAEARIGAGATRLEALTAEAEAGSGVSAQQTKLAELESEIQDIFEANRGFLNDKEDEAADAILALAAREEDPQIRIILQQRAARVRSKAEDF